MTDQRGLKAYHVEISVQTGPDVVWDAVIQPPVLREWFGWDYNGLDAEIEHIFVDQAEALGTRRLGWVDGSYLEVSGDDGRARVRAARDGVGPVDPDQYDAVEEAWRAVLVQLKFLLERQPGGRRRTIYLTGETTGTKALGLVDVQWEWLGTRVAWTVDAAGCLVVVAGRAPLAHPLAARAEVTVSTYGLDDAAFESLRADWTSRWMAIASSATITTGDDPAPKLS